MHRVANLHLTSIAIQMPDFYYRVLWPFRTAQEYGEHDTRRSGIQTRVARMADANSATVGGGVFSNGRSRQAVMA